MILNTIMKLKSILKYTFYVVVMLLVSTTATSCLNYDPDLKVVWVEETPDKTGLCGMTWVQTKFNDAEVPVDQRESYTFNVDGTGVCNIYVDGEKSMQEISWKSYYNGSLHKIFILAKGYEQYGATECDYSIKYGKTLYIYIYPLDGGSPIIKEYKAE